MIQMRVNVVLPEIGALNAGQRYELADNVEAMLVNQRKAIAVNTKALRAPKVK